MDSWLRAYRADWCLDLVFQASNHCYQIVPVRLVWDMHKMLFGSLMHTAKTMRTGNACLYCLLSLACTLVKKLQKLGMADTSGHISHGQVQFLLRFGRPRCASSCSRTVRSVQSSRPHLDRHHRLWSGPGAKNCSCCDHRSLQLAGVCKGH